MQQTIITRSVFLYCFIFYATILLGNNICAGVPSFAQKPLYNSNSAQVLEIVPTHSADVVFLDGGLEQGLRLGMVCRISRAEKSVGELIIIESRSDRAAGLILKLSGDIVLRVGDIAEIKTFLSS